MSTAGRWKGSLLSEAGVGKAAFWLVCIPSAIGILTVLPSGISIPAGIALWLVSSVVSTGFLGLVLLASAQARVRIPPWGRAIVVVLTMVLAGAARGIGIVLCFGLLGFQESTTVLGRVVGSSVIFTIWLLLIGAFLSSLAGYRAARQTLLDEIVMRELQMRLVDEPRAEGKREDATARLSETTAMVRELLDSADMGDAEEYARISLLLHRAIDERIRPLVHEMWQEPAPEFDAPTSTFAFLRKAYLTAVPLAWALPLYAVIETSGAVITTGWQVGLLAATVEWVIFAGILLVERRMTPKPRLVARTIAFLGITLAPALGAWFIVGGQPAAQIPFFALFAFMITAPILTFACCAGRAVLDERGPSLRELQDRLQRDDWAEQLEMLETRAAENSVASVIHNTVQARLLAAALQLETAAMTNDQIRAEHALEDARTALDSTDRSTARLSPAERLASISEAWRGILVVDFALAEGAEGLPSIWLGLDAVEECVANAARHASASEVEVSLRRLSGGLEVVVSDNGSPMDMLAEQGLGSDWMRRITAGRLSRSRTAGGWNQVRLLIG